MFGIFKKKHNSTFDELEKSVINYTDALTNFGKILSGNEFTEVKNFGELFDAYDKIKLCVRAYLDEKALLKDKKIDLENNPYIARFKKCHLIQHEYESKLLTMGVDLKTRTLNTNKTLLGEALRIEKDSTAKLMDGLKIIIEARDTGAGTLATLQENKEKIQRIDNGLDGVESELELARKQLTVFAKRLYTDKVIIALTTLAVLGTAGAITLGTGLVHIPPITIPNL